MSFVQDLLSDPEIPAIDRKNALDRAFSDPGFPDKSRGSTESFWMKNESSDVADDNVLSKVRSRHQVPEEAGVVIIGSGITGASVARTLLLNRRGKAENASIPSVVMLEARDICSGATGRNGGHIIETADSYAEFVDAFGADAAQKLIKFRLAHLDAILGVADELGLTAHTQARRVQFLSVFYDGKSWAEAKERLKRFKEGMPEVAKDWRAYESESIPEEFKLDIATTRGVISGPAGAVWPYRFVTGVLAHLRRKFPNDFLIETNTPAVEIIRKSSDDVKESYFSVFTPRGSIKTRHVVHCTNGHIGHLIPRLRGRVSPVRGQMSAQDVGETFPQYGTKHSWIFNYERGFDYLTQLPADHSNLSSSGGDGGGGGGGGGEMMLGGGFAQAAARGLEDFGIATDEHLNPRVGMHLSRALSNVFNLDQVSTSEPSFPRIKSMWTGTMGFSADGLPWVGKLPDSLLPPSSPQNSPSSSSSPSYSPTAPAQWLAAGFSGEGMVNAWLCGKALARMILKHDNNDDRVVEGESGDGEEEEGGGQDKETEWVLPEQMLITEERVQRAFLHG